MCHLESTRIKVVDGVEIRISDQDVRARPPASWQMRAAAFSRKPPSAQEPAPPWVAYAVGQRPPRRIQHRQIYHRWINHFLTRGIHGDCIWGVQP